MQAELSEFCGVVTWCYSGGRVQGFASVPWLLVPHRRCRFSFALVLIGYLELAGRQLALASCCIVNRRQIIPFLHVGPVLLRKQSSVLGRSVLEDDLALLEALELGYLGRRWRNRIVKFFLRWTP